MSDMRCPSCRYWMQDVDDKPCVHCSECYSSKFEPIVVDEWFSQVKELISKLNKLKTYGDYEIWGVDFGEIYPRVFMNDAETLATNLGIETTRQDIYCLFMNDSVVFRSVRREEHVDDISEGSDESN